MKTRNGYHPLVLLVQGQHLFLFFSYIEDFLFSILQWYCIIQRHLLFAITWWRLLAESLSLFVQTVHQFVFKSCRIFLSLNIEAIQVILLAALLCSSIFVQKNILIAATFSFLTRRVEICIIRPTSDLLFSDGSLKKKFTGSLYALVFATAPF